VSNVYCLISNIYCQISIQEATMKSILTKGLFLFLIICVGKSCVPPEYGKETYVNIQIDFKSKEVQKLYDLQERQNIDSLRLYLRSDNPTFRYIAATAMGALKDSASIDSIAPLLKDTLLDIRIAAAHALGQIGKYEAEKHLIKAYESKDEFGEYAPFNAAALEAIGKCGNKQSLNNLINIKTFELEDSILLRGQAFGIYRFGLRDTFSDASIAKMVSFVGNTTFPTNVRTIAAHYLARLKSRYDSTVTNPICTILLTEKNPDITMALGRALGRAYNPAFVLPTLENVYKTSTDYRVKVNIINGLGEFEYAKIQPLLMLAVRDRNIHVSNTAAQFLVNKGNEVDAGYYKMMVNNDEIPSSTRHIMMGAALKWLIYYPKIRDTLSKEIQYTYNKTPNPFEKAQILRGLAEYGWNYDFIRDEAFKKDNPKYLKTVAAECIVKIITSPDFFNTFKLNASKAKKDLKAALFGMIRTGDAGMIAVAAEALRDPAADLNKKMMRDSVSALYQVMQRLKIPEESESYEVLRQTIGYIVDAKDIGKKKLTAPRSIDFSILGSLNETSLVTIKTTKGDIKLKLLTQNAPISVANFILLARSNFFNKKTFHRVVPNFVVQTGCPRGDGYGSLDYTISSELTPQHYDTEGYVGMASAGNHTECSQWFITHSATFHLDVNYSIFAKVISGMEVVHKIEVGDIVETVTVN
jgi:cyclophilin family peptidyl-prolyl cis-trans isomerase/HEAT repeat protein